MIESFDVTNYFPGIKVHARNKVNLLNCVSAQDPLLWCRTTWPHITSKLFVLTRNNEHTRRMEHRPKEYKIDNMNVFGKTTVLKWYYITKHACAGVCDNVKPSIIHMSKLVRKHFKLSTVLPLTRITAMNLHYSAANVCATLSHGVNIQSQKCIKTLFLNDCLFNRDRWLTFQ